MPPQKNAVAGSGKVTGKLPVSGLVITKNESGRIERCLQSLAPLCMELIVVDSLSTDGTQELARNAGATVIEQAWPGFAAQKNFALEQASQPWVLFLDADEWLSDELASELRRRFTAANGFAPVEQHDIYRVYFRTLFFGRTLRYGEPGQQQIIRLMRSTCRYKKMRVHEQLDLTGQRVSGIENRSAVMMHDTFRSLALYHQKLMAYAALSAADKFERGNTVTFLDLWLRPLVYLLKNYVFRLGFLDGLSGYIYHRMQADYVFTKYARLWEKRQTAKQPDE
ncbi:MAG: glycosyltransferase family 2 protein [Rhizobacter sp.]|nr:glycosyltransferase family 2 protein [Chlorobiales bacterium]